MSIYVLIAVGDDYRVRECVAVSDLKTAEDLYAILRKAWPCSKVCMASRSVDDIPDNLVRAMNVSEVSV